jgi:hypothetical protein
LLRTKEMAIIIRIYPSRRSRKCSKKLKLPGNSFLINSFYTILLR